MSTPEPHTSVSQQVPSILIGVITTIVTDAVTDLTVSLQLLLMIPLGVLYWWLVTGRHWFKKRRRLKPVER